MLPLTSPMYQIAYGLLSMTKSLEICVASWITNKRVSLLGMSVQTVISKSILPTDNARLPFTM